MQLCVLRTEKGRGRIGARLLFFGKTRPVEKKFCDEAEEQRTAGLIRVATGSDTSDVRRVLFVGVVGVV